MTGLPPVAGTLVAVCEIVGSHAHVVGCHARADLVDCHALVDGRVDVVDCRGSALFSAALLLRGLAHCDSATEVA